MKRLLGDSFLSTTVIYSVLVICAVERAPGLVLGVLFLTVSRELVNKIIASVANKKQVDDAEKLKSLETELKQINTALSFRNLK